MFATTEDGDHYVGLEIIRPKEAGIIYLHQTRYINEVIITISYVNNMVVTRTTEEVTLKPKITKWIFVQTHRQLNC